MSDTNNTVLTQSDVDKADYDRVEESAQFIHLLYTRFRKMGYALSNRKKRALARVLEAVLFEPLHEIKLDGKAEKDLFDICQQVLYHKDVLKSYAIEQKIKEEENKNG